MSFNMPPIKVSTSCGGMLPHTALKSWIAMKTTATLESEQLMLASVRASSNCFSKMIGTYFDQETIATCSLPKVPATEELVGDGHLRAEAGAEEPAQ